VVRVVARWELRAPGLGELIVFAATVWRSAPSEVESPLRTLRGCEIWSSLFPLQSYEERRKIRAGAGSTARFALTLGSSRAISCGGVSCEHP